MTLSWKRQDFRLPGAGFNARGSRIAISTDADSIGGLDNMRFGVDQARRGWIEAEDVINTRPLEKLLRLCKRK